MNNSSHYHCPLCSQLLVLKNKSLVCDNHHSFDYAKEGYVNLLPVQFKHSKNPGDNKAMVKARRLFLEKSHYQPLLNKMIDLCHHFHPKEQQPVILDSGCGEGYYTNQHQKICTEIYGVDIAKEAIKLAAKKYKRCHFSVGSVAQYPFDDNYFDWIYSIYAPLKESEFLRLLKAKGYLLTVTPAPKHLFELKALIYDKPMPHQVDELPIKEMSLVHQEQLSYQFTLEQAEERLALLSMTPFAFKSSDKLIEQLESQQHLTCTADFMIRIYQKSEN